MAVLEKVICRAHNLNRILIVGVSGTGKSTLYTQKILASKARWKFVFEPDEIGGFAQEARLPIAHTVQDMAAHLKTRRIVVFNSDRLFPGDRAAGFEFFCRWVYNVSSALPGDKLLAGDEVQEYTPDPMKKLPMVFALLMDKSRKFRLDTIFVTNGPNKMHVDLRKQCNELVVFKHFEPLVLKWIEERGISRDDVATLRPRGHYIRRDMLTGQNSFSDTYATRTLARRRKATPDQSRMRNNPEGFARAKA